MLNRFQLKLLMLFLMVVDHVGSFIPNTPIWLNYIGRVVAPVFFFLLVDGFFYTRNKFEYARRLFLASGIMVLGNILVPHFLIAGKDLLNIGISVIVILISIGIIVNIYLLRRMKPEHFVPMLLIGAIFALIPVVLGCMEKGFTLYNNIFLSMAFCISLLIGIEKRRDKEEDSRILWIILISLLASTVTEGSFIVLGMTLIFYNFRDNKKMIIISYTILSLLLALGDISIKGLFLERIQWMMVFALPFFFIYNNEKGKDIKYLFYVFYPVHIWILYILGFYLSN